MASDNHAHYARIGFTVVIGVAAIVATLIYLGGISDRNASFLVETYYDSPVNGLSVGSPVNLLGVKIGEVRDISFASATYFRRGANSNDFGRVCIVMAINRKLLAMEGNMDDEEIAKMIDESSQRGLRATVSVNGITGLSRVDLKIVENAQAEERPAWTPRYPLIMPSPSLLESFSVAATKFMNKLKTMDFTGVWSNLQTTANSAASIARNTDAIVDSQRTRVNEMIRNANEVTLSLKELTGRLKDNPSLLLRPNDPEQLEETK